MGIPRRIDTDVYMIGGHDISHPDDCAVYLIDAGGLVLIDCGAGASYDKLIRNISKLNLSPANVQAILVTHAHIDHIGALKQFKEELDVRIVAHELDAYKIEKGTGVGAELYGIDYVPCQVDVKLNGDDETLEFAEKDLKVIHIPGHTPGSIAAYIDIDDKRILFGQDIHGPYIPEWGANIEDARISLQKLIDLKADILCEGHFGIYRPSETVVKYIKGYLNSL